jgi:2-oxoglutarate dehydrogenase complex dehydrogenase (E1) component-like enzyme
MKALINLSKNKSYIKTQFLTNHSFSTTFKRYKESNLKGYINHFRKNAHKYANVNPLNSQNQKCEEFSADFWELAQTEKLEEFPFDHTSAFNSSLLNSATTIQDLEAYLSKAYLNGVIYLMII